MEHARQWIAKQRRVLSECSPFTMQFGTATVDVVAAATNFIEKWDAAPHDEDDYHGTDEELMAVNAIEPAIDALRKALRRLILPR